MSSSSTKATAPLETKTIDEHSERVFFKLRNPNFEDLLRQKQKQQEEENKNKNKSSQPTTEEEKTEVTSQEESASANDDKKFNAPFIPSAVVRMDIDPMLLHFLSTSDEAFATPGSQETSHDDDKMESLGFIGPLNDGHHMPKSHIYHEGYFHAFHECMAEGKKDEEKKNKNDEEASKPKHIDDPVQSMNPRYGHPMLKPAAPRVFRAFLLAFKKVNRPWLENLIEKLNLPFLDLDTAFADCAAQSHYGAEVSISPEKPGGWHWDSGNSILHLAVSLSGERYLHFNHHSEAVADDDKETTSDDQNQKQQENDDQDAENGNPTKSKKKKDWAQDHYDRLKNTPGCVYLTSPSAFKHAVEYPKCDFPNRIFAVQCRTLINNNDGAREYRQREEKIDWSMKEAIVGECFRNQEGIRLPTFEETLEVLSEMEKSVEESATKEATGEKKKCVIQ